MPFAQWPGMWQPTTNPLTSAGTVHVASARSPERTTSRSPASAAGTLTAAVGPGGASAVASSADSQASWVVAGPTIASWMSSPALTTCRTMVSPGMTSRVAGLYAYSRAITFTSRGRARVPAVGWGVVTAVASHAASAVVTTITRDSQTRGACRRATAGAVSGP